MLLGVPGLKLPYRFRDRCLLVGHLDIAEKLSASADQRNFPGMLLLRGFLRGHQLKHSTGNGATPTL